MGRRNSEITFDIATNFDPQFIREVSTYGIVDWVYGKMNNDIIGGGRASIILPRFSWGELKRHIDLCHGFDLKFNYLLNALCLGNQEFRKKFHRQLISLLDKLTKYNVDGVTVASPYLCDLIKKQYPHFDVSVSVYNHVTTLQQIKYWERAGADEITLFQSVNRDFNSLRAFLSYTSHTGTRLRLIANNSCLHECPFHENHAIANSHSSQKGHASNKFYIDYHILKCNNYKMKNPAHLIASEWIRPEDVEHYSRLCEETGNYNLALKLTDRSKTTDFLLRAARAYRDRRYDGNLFDIINLVTNKDRRQFHSMPFVKRAVLGLYNLKMLKKLKEILSTPQLYLDNKLLDGFLEKFINGHDCSKHVCNDDPWQEEHADCSDHTRCGYCMHWGHKAFRFDNSERLEWIKKSDSVLDDIKASRLFSISG